MAAMTLANPASLSNYFQPVLNKQLIDRIDETLKLNELAQQVDLPKNLGSKTIKFFQFDVAADASKVQTLAEGVAPASNTYRELGLNTVEVGLTQYGEILTVTDLLSATSLLDVLKASEGADQRDDGDQNTDSHLHGGDAALGLFVRRLGPRAESR